MAISRNLVIFWLFVFISGCATISSPKKLNFVNGQAGYVPPLIESVSWRKVEDQVLAVSDGNILHKATYYKHPKHFWYMSVHKVFGNEVMRAYSIRDNEDNLLEHWYLIRKNKEWFMVRSSKMKRTYTQDSNNARKVAVIFSVLDENEQILISATYKN